MIDLISIVLEGRRAAIDPGFTMSLAVVGLGTFAVDARSTPIVQPGWIDGAEIAILTNEQTLRRMLSGRFEVGRNAGDLFLWEGDDQALERLAQIFGGRSMLEVRASLSRSARRAR